MIIREKFLFLKYLILLWVCLNLKQAHCQVLFPDPGLGLITSANNKPGLGGLIPSNRPGLGGFPVGVAVPSRPVLGVVPQIPPVPVPGGSSAIPELGLPSSNPDHVHFQLYPNPE